MMLEEIDHASEKETDDKFEMMFAQLSFFGSMASSGWTLDKEAIFWIVEA